MSWDFETDPVYQKELDWVEQFVSEEVEPVDFVVKHAWDLQDPVRQRLIPPLQARVQERGLWAAHLGPHLGGPGYGQLKLALLNEILGRTHSGPIVFGCQAPAARALQIHGSLGVSDEMPFGAMVLESFHMGLADGATEVHKLTLARELLKDHKASDDLFPTTHLPKLRAQALAKYDDVLVTTM